LRIIEVHGNEFNLGGNGNLNISVVNINPSTLILICKNDPSFIIGTRFDIDITSILYFRMDIFKHYIINLSKDILIIGKLLVQILN
jgi:hypothetical protein